MKYLLVVVILLQLERNLFVQGLYFVTNETYSSTVDVHCQLAQPILTLDRDSYIATIPEINVLPNESVWVGFAQSRTVFEYIGCVNKDLLSGSVKKTSLRETPGACYSICQSTFGVYKRECYCLPMEVTVSVKEPFCNVTCADQSSVLCGGRNARNTYVSLYSYGNQMINAGVNGVCLYLEPTSRDLTWDTCSTRYEAMCFNGTSVYRLNKFDAWNVAVRLCFMNNSLPVRYNYSRILLDKSGSQLWTGVIHSEAVVKTDGKTTSPRVTIGILQKEKQSGVFTLTFPIQSTLRRALCDADVLTTVEPKTSTTEQLEKTTSTSSFINRTETAEITTTTTQTPTTSLPSAVGSTNGPESESKETESVSTVLTTMGQHFGPAKAPNIGVPVGVSMAVVFLAGIVAIVILKRRYVTFPKTTKTQKEVTKHKESDLNDYTEIPDVGVTNGGLRYSGIMKNGESHNYYEAETPTAGHKGTTLNSDISKESLYNEPDQNVFVNGISDDRTVEEDEHYSHSYFILEKQNKQTDTCEGTYNVTRDNENHLLQESDVYNKLNNSATYDLLHTYSKHSGPKKDGIDNTYETNGTGMKVDSKHAKGNDSVYNKVSGFEESDTYNHISGKTTKATDNVYGLSAQSSV